MDFEAWEATVFPQKLSHGTNMKEIFKQPWAVPEDFDSFDIESGNHDQAKWKANIRALTETVHFMIPTSRKGHEESCDCYLFVELFNPKTKTAEKYVVLIDAKSVSDAEEDQDQQFFRGHCLQVDRGQDGRKSRSKQPCDQYGKL
jgi:hypothetical protein